MLVTARIAAIQRDRSYSPAGADAYHYLTVLWVHVSLPTKLHLNQFSCVQNNLGLIPGDAFCRAHSRDQQTDRERQREADRQTMLCNDVCSNSPHLAERVAIQAGKIAGDSDSEQQRLTHES